MVRIFDLVSDWWISMLAPPGYARISRQTSARLAAGFAGFVFNFTVSVVLLIVFGWIYGLVDDWINGATRGAFSQLSTYPFIQSSIFRVCLWRRGQG